MAEQLRKSTKLNLRFPYDWSNPSISDEALILNVLNRGLFADICRICAYFGIDAARDVASSARQSAIAKSLLRV